MNAAAGRGWLKIPREPHGKNNTSERDPTGDAITPAAGLAYAKIAASPTIKFEHRLMKRMLINATQIEEMRVALVDGQKLYDLDIESLGHEQKKANIYKGVITRVEPSLEAAFVNYGAQRHGFLPLKEISKEYFTDGHAYSSRTDLSTALPEGTEVIVQIEKEERGSKGAALTTYISLAGSYLVLMPNNPRAGGISRRIEGEEREEMRAVLDSIEVPRGMGVIVRTAGVGKAPSELEWDLNVLTTLWKFIKSASDENEAPLLIYQESNVVLRAIRDYLRPDIGEILIDDKETYDQALRHINLVRPEFASRVKLYEGEIPLFTHYQIENQIESAFQRKVRLPSGGEIVIDPTEALTSIDINSAKATKGGDIEETALQTNLEAADEIARQLRMRDLGGLFVIDFIDMTPIKNQREVENRMREAVQQDRARVQIAKISRFGLLELSRQRIKPSINDANMHVCPRCSGQGFIRDEESLSLSILRLIEEEALKEKTSQVYAMVPISVCAYLLNEKRDAVKAIEGRHGVRVFIMPDAKLETPHYDIYRVRDGETLDDVLREREEEEGCECQHEHAYGQFAAKEKAKREEPAVNSVMAVQEAEHAPSQTRIAISRFFRKLGDKFKSLFGSSDDSSKKSQGKRKNGPSKNVRGKDAKKDRNPKKQDRAQRSNEVSERPDRQENRRDRFKKDDRPQRGQKPGRNARFGQESENQDNRQMRNEQQQQATVQERRERRDRRGTAARIREEGSDQAALAEMQHASFIADNRGFDAEIAETQQQLTTEVMESRGESSNAPIQSNNQDKRKERRERYDRNEGQERRERRSGDRFEKGERKERRERFDRGEGQERRERRERPQRPAQTQFQTQAPASLTPWNEGRETTPVRAQAPAAGASFIKNMNHSEPALPEKQTLPVSAPASARIDNFDEEKKVKAAGFASMTTFASEPALPEKKELAAGAAIAEMPAEKRYQPRISGKAAGFAELRSINESAMALPEKKDMPKAADSAESMQDAQD